MINTLVTASSASFQLPSFSPPARSSSLERVSPELKRRHAFAAALAVTLFTGTTAQAKSVQEANRAKAERKKALEEAARAMREEKRAVSAFGDSEYAVSEDHSPNVHTRQEEGVRTSKS